MSFDRFGMADSGLGMTDGATWGADDRPEIVVAVHWIGL